MRALTVASLTYDLTLAGLTVGSAAALTGMGLVVTYRATGVLNLAHGAIAMVCAYVLRQLVVEWHWPLLPAAAVTLLLAAPGLGVLLDVLVFRPLSVQGNDPARTLVASIGVFVLLVGGAALLWGPGARADAPALVTGEPWGQLAVVAALAALVGAVTRWTRFGGEVRAVVDDRELAALGGIDTDRVASVGWAFGAFTAGLTGVLLAPYVRLDPYGLPLLVVEVIAVAVIARMRGVVVAAGAALLIGVAQAQLTRFHPAGRAEPLVQAVGANLFVVALLVAALVLPGVGTRDALSRTTVAAVRIPPAAWLVAGVLFLLPLGFAGSDLHTSVQVPALAIVLLSLVVVSGRGGQISLGQTAYAGLGALFTGRLSQSVPELVALLLAVLLVAPLGLLTGRPAIHRHGLALALATLAVSVATSRFVFAQPYATSGLTLTRPAGLGDDRAYYAVELALLVCALLAVAALRRGRTGRALAAMRDHEEGARAAGVPVPALKVVAFVTGAALAALGGGLLSMGLRAFDPGAYDPVRGLLWFAAVVVLGADNLLGAPAAAALLVGLDAGTRGGVAAAAVGLLALLVGRFPQTHELLSRWRRPPKAPPAPVRKVYALPAGPAPAAAPELAAHAVRLSYGSYTVLAGVDLTVPPGRVTALIGGNGAGKTTLFHCLCGTLRPDAGRVAFGGTDITRRPAHARTRLGIARTFQQIAVFPSLTVEENVRIGAEQGRVRDPAAVEQALRLMGLAGGVRRLPAAGLPTGTLRRVELGRALAGRPHTLLLDEPAAGLDTAEAGELARVLRALAADGMAVLVVEHDLDLVADIADTVHVMRAGRIGGQGPGR